MNFDKAYVIGSEKIFKKRLDNFFKKKYLKNKDIQIWEAINGADVNIKKYQELNYLVDDFKVKMPGSLGCLLSHLTLWNHCFEDKNCDIALILEDDVILKNNFEELVDNIDGSALPRDWTILRLSYKGLIGKNISKDIVKPDCIKKKGVNAGSWCYLLNSSNAEILINTIIPYENKNSMDVLLRNNIDKINMYFSKKNLAIHAEKRYSPRKDLNNPKKTLLQYIKFTLRKYFYS